VTSHRQAILTSLGPALRRREIVEDANHFRGRRMAEGHAIVIYITLLCHHGETVKTAESRGSLTPQGCYPQAS
jgi:hypothetical protein